MTLPVETNSRLISVLFKGAQILSNDGESILSLISIVSPDRQLVPKRFAQFTLTLMTNCPCVRRRIVQVLSDDPVKTLTFLGGEGNSIISKIE